MTINWTSREGKEIIRKEKSYGLIHDSVGSMRGIVSNLNQVAVADMPVERILEAERLLKELSNLSQEIYNSLPEESTKYL